MCAEFCANCKRGLDVMGSGSSRTANPEKEEAFKKWKDGLGTSAKKPDKSMTKFLAAHPRYLDKVKTGGGVANITITAAYHYLTRHQELIVPPSVPHLV